MKSGSNCICCNPGDVWHSFIQRCQVHPNPVDDENFLRAGPVTTHLCPRCPAQCLAQNRTSVMFVGCNWFSWVSVESGSLFLTTHFIFPAGVKFSLVGQGPLSFPSVAHIFLALFLGANHSAEELRRSCVAWTGGLQGNVPSLVSKGENPGMGWRQREWYSAGNAFHRPEENLQWTGWR